MPGRSGSRERRPSREALTWFIVIAAAGLAVRLLYLFQARASDPLLATPFMDVLYHHRWALAIVSGGEFTGDAFFRAPLYPHFLAGVYGLFGSGPLAARLVQMLLGSASCGLVYLVARRLADAWKRGGRGAHWVPRAAGLAVAGYPLAVYFDGELLIPVLLTFLVLLGLLLFLRSRDRNGQWWLPGAVFGLAVLARPNVLAFIGLAAVWFVVEYRRRSLRPLLQFWAAAAVVIAPVTVRNLVVSGDFVPIAWQGGTNFYIGNNPDADGVTAVLPGTRPSWWGGYNDARRLAEQAVGRTLSGAEIDRYWLGRGFGFIGRNPGRALVLLARKTWLLFAGLEVSNNRDVYFFKRYSFLDVLLFRTPVLKFPFGLAVPLALAGVMLLRRRWRRLLPLYLFVAAYGASFVVFFVTARFRMPMVPVLLVLAVAGVSAFARAPAHERYRAAAAAVAALLLFNLDLAGPFRPRHDQSHFLIAQSLHEQGRDDEALAAVERALALDSAVNVLNLEATLALGARRAERAERAAGAAVRLEPGNAEAVGTLGNVMAATGRLDSARVCFEKTVELDPYAVQGWNNLGNVALEHRDLETARGYYQRALAIDPTFVMAIFHLGLIEYYSGNRELAHERWREVLRLEPGHAKAALALRQLN